MNNNLKNRKYIIKIGNKGFTLVELLSVVAILSIIVSVVIFFAFRIINSANEKSYATTINNIEDDANNYILENIDVTTWMPTGVDGNEYQCVKVQDLIDVGYFKGDVLESKIDKNTYVDANDYIYVERNSHNAVTKNILLAGEEDYSSYLELCNRKPVAPTYIISYNANGGSGAPANQIKNENENITLSSVVPTRNGWRFIGWNTRVDGSGTSYNPSDVYDKNVAITLYAQWSDKKIYTVTYVKVEGLGPGATDDSTKQYCKNANGDVSGEMVQTTCIEGEDCKLSKNAFSRDDLVFAGWTTTKYNFYSTSKPSVKYTDGYTIKGGITSDITLYTVWNSAHNWKAVGTRLVNISSSRFQCGHVHTVAYTIYCTECSMARSHYRDCYKPAYESSMTLHCPVALGADMTTLVDDSALDNGGTSSSAAKYYGGTIEGREKFKNVSRNQFVSKDKHDSSNYVG